jgi:large subunit ribosomal protein L10
MKNKAKKVEYGNELREEFGAADALYIADFRGITVIDLTKLRFELKKVGASFKVVKNRIALRALDAALADQLQKTFDEMTAVAIVQGDIAAAAKTLLNFAKTNTKLKVRGGILEGRILSSNDVKALSNLPSRQQLLGQLVGLWASVPTGFVRVLNGVPSGWVNVLDSLRRKKEAGA